MGRITLYVSNQSPDRFVQKAGEWAKQVLDGKKLAYMEVDVSMMQDQLENMYKLSLGLNKALPQLYFNNKIVAFGPNLSEKLDQLQEQGKFDGLVAECFAGPDPVNPPYIGIWHPGDGSGKLVLEWQPDEEEYSSSGDEDHAARKSGQPSSFTGKSSGKSGDRTKKKRKSKHQRERDRRNKEEGKTRSSSSSSSSSSSKSSKSSSSRSSKSSSSKSSSKSSSSKSSEKPPADAVPSEAPAQTPEA